MLEKMVVFGKNLPAKLRRKENLTFVIMEWNKIYADDFWNIGSLPEVANWGGEQLLLRELKKKIKDEHNFHYAMERLTAPEDFSFYQKEELDLLALKKIKNKKELEKKLAKHQQKYFWLLNSYYNTKVLPTSYFKKILNSFSPVAAKEKIKEIHKLKDEAVKHKKEVVRKFSLPKKILKISRCLAFSIWWQDHRKSYIFQANHIIDLLLKALSKQHGVDFDDLHHYSVREIENLAVKGKKLSAKEIKSRRKNFFIVFNPRRGKELHISGERAKKLATPYIEEKVDLKIKEFKGLVINRGKARGKVRILLSPNEAKKMKKGEILVAAMTSPDYIVALRKAAAVVTDEGGMTCHAAIVSRELKIPGIVRARIATKVLKDGDLVEVDANKGIVKILK